MSKPKWEKAKVDGDTIYRFGPDFSVVYVRVKGRYGWEIHCMAYYRELPLHAGTLHFPGKSSLPYAKRLCEDRWHQKMFRQQRGIPDDS